MNDDDRTADFAVLAENERRLLTRRFFEGDNAADLLDDGFVEFGRSGTVYTRAQTLSALLAEHDTGGGVADLADLVIRPLSSDLALLTYTSCRRHDDGRTDRGSLRSSIWRRTAGQWRLVFHQGTPQVSVDAGSEPPSA